VEVNGGLRNCKLICNLFIAIDISNEPQHFQFPCRGPARHLWRAPPLAYPCLLEKPDDTQRLGYEIGLPRPTEVRLVRVIVVPV
jgi:hypothetical protein